MVIRGSAAKRHRQNITRRLGNRSIRSSVRTAEKKVLASLKNGTKEETQQLFNVYMKAIDTAAGKNIFHKNSAARKKSRLQIKVSKMS